MRIRSWYNRPMEIYGLRLPDGFVRLLDDGGRTAVVHAQGGVDAYGYPLAMALGELYGEEAALMRATARVAIGFEADGWYGARSPETPGALVDIVDFSRIVCFGSSPDGEPFCFDFREWTLEPSVICWDGAMTIWRRIAPDWSSFAGIFGLESGDGEGSN